MYNMTHGFDPCLQSNLLMILQKNGQQNHVCTITSLPLVGSFYTWYKYVYSPLGEGVLCIMSFNLDLYFQGHLLMTGSFTHAKNWDKKRKRPGTSR